VAAGRRAVRPILHDGFSGVSRGVLKDLWLPVLLSHWRYDGVPILHVISDEFVAV